MVEGEVRDHDTGEPLAGAAVSLGAGPSAARGRGTRITDEDGRFSFEAVPAGTYRIFVRIQGYLDMRDTLQVSTGDLDIVLPLSTQVIALEPILVSVGRPDLGRRDYGGRRTRGGAGLLVTREEIMQRNPRLISEMLHRMGGGMVVPTPPYGYTLLLRGQCRPGIWVDGVPMPGANSIDQVVSPQNVEAVEVYHGFELPVEFGVNSCGGILVWTRRGTPPPDGEEGESGFGILQSLVAAAALVALIMVAAH